MKRTLIMLFVLISCIGLFAQKKGKPLPENVIYIDYKYAGSNDDMERSVQKTIISEVLEPYYEGFGYQKAGKLGNDIVITVNTSGFKQEIVSYNLSVKVNGQPIPSTLYMRFDYSIAFSSPLGLPFDKITGSFSDFYKYNPFSRIPKLRVPELTKIAIRPMVPHKDVAFGETSDMRKLGISPLIPEKAAKKSNYWLSIDTKGLKGKHLGTVYIDVEDFVADDLKKIAQRTYDYNEADFFIAVIFTSYQEEEEYNTIKVQNDKGQYYDKRVKGVHSYLGYQLEVRVPCGWASQNQVSICGITAKADGWEQLPVMQYAILQEFPDISALDFKSFAELGKQNRNLRMATNPEYNTFLWIGNIGELSKDPNEPIVKFTDIKDGILGVAETFEAVTNLTQLILDEGYLSPRDPYDISEHVPPKVIQQELPPLPALVKDQFETTQQFEERVATAQSKRQQDVNAEQEEFAQRVRNRNAKIEALEKYNKAEIGLIAKEQEIKKGNLPFVYPEIVQGAVTYILGYPKIRNLQYDADTQTVHGEIYSAKSEYSLRFTQTFPAQQAKEYMGKVAQMIPVLTYKVQADITANSISNQQLQLVKLCTYLEGTQYPAELSNENYQPKQITFQLQEKKVAWDSDEQVDMTMQDPLLVDRIKVESMRVSEKSKVINNDLIELVEKTPQASVDEKKWLFIVGIENYNNTYPIDFSLDSADLFEKAAVKTLGIRDSHIYKLRDAQATTASIKDKLSLMLDRVEDGDVIYFYYSGHGMPAKGAVDDTSVEYDPYLVPVDGSPNLMINYPDMKAISIYQKLTTSKAAKVVCFIDACFSGDSEYAPLTPKGELAAGLLVAKQPSFDKNKMVLLSATQSGQTARAYQEKGNRLFTYFLIKSLLSTNTQNPTAQELFNLYAKDVKKISYDKGDAFRQDPSISGNVNLNIK